MRYRKKPLEIEAIQWTGNNTNQIKEFSQNNVYIKEPLDFDGKSMGFLIIATGDARYTANIGDYIIKGINNELYVCKNDIFHITYELVEEDVIKRI